MLTFVVEEEKRGGILQSRMDAHRQQQVVLSMLRI
jgi:hypothetical protein